MIQIKAWLDEKALTALSRHSILFLTKILIAVAVLIGGIGTILIIAEFDMTVSITVTVAGVIVPAFLLLATYFYIPRQVKKAPLLSQNIEQEFTFGENVLLTEKSTVCEAKNIQYDWKAFYRAVETNDYFFLHINKYVAFILPKSSFTQGTPDELRAMFIDKFGKGFTCPSKLKNSSKKK